MTTWKNPGRDQVRLTAMNEMIGEDTANNDAAMTSAGIAGGTALLAALI